MSVNISRRLELQNLRGSFYKTSSGVTSLTRSSSKLKLTSQGILHYLWSADQSYDLVKYLSCHNTVSIHFVNFFFFFSIF